MERVVSNIIFNGQFWIALIEKYQEDGSLLVGRYTFGPEPANNHLLDFYLNKYHKLKFYQCEPGYKVKKEYYGKDSGKNTGKALESFKREQKKYLLEKKKIRKIEKKAADEDKYIMKREKKIQKRRGH
ncbi:MAG: DUF2992 family protein [Spirochaetales bacterium]|nr:DUF2992 family protein [Spirochaetales bacterium]